MFDPSFIGLIGLSKTNIPFISGVVVRLAEFCFAIVPGIPVRIGEWRSIDPFPDVFAWLACNTYPDAFADYPLEDTIKEYYKDWYDYEVTDEYLEEMLQY